MTEQSLLPSAAGKEEGPCLGVPSAKDFHGFATGPDL